MLHINPKTIFALSTAPGKAGISVIRISGSSVRKVSVIFSIELPKPRQVKLCQLIHPITKEVIDNSLITFFPSPKSFTGEDVIEISIHGGKAIQDLIFRVLSEQDDFVYAEAGEFTKRAFLNGKLDLLAIEGLGDLINAETEFQRKQAYDQMEGSLSSLYNKWISQLVKILSYIEATIDFVEEEIPDNLVRNQLKDIKSTCIEIENHLDDSNKGERLRDGFRIIIAGAPNTGKSSLLNHLSDRDIAIVSPQAGTTRDSLDVYLDINGFPVIITDTAGIRKARTSIEGIGIKRSESKIYEADLVLWLMDSSKKNNKLIPDNIKEKSIAVWTKSDIAISKEKDILISTKHNLGFVQLIDIIGKYVEKGCRTEGLFITRSRHRDALEKTRKHLLSITNENNLEIEVMAEELRSAVNSLGRITGNVDVEDLLEIIFADFCIGK
ncbi:MAG: tRNA uridine-5-carboxymethylaminomethyl(34) synthesis GTPase MnmE [Hyphomicrobiales bacterium]|jgi:tRNA modification GTPase|nr:tRNA uridine-5-carboxymethylaminomethyl(34) synthesis GTPase MnmE [Hyphomicrobiales bacterium]